MSSILGQTQNLKQSHKKELERLLKFKTTSDQLLSWNTAKHLCEISQKINKQIGLILNRKGKVTEVVVGNAKSVPFPHLERFRKGLVRLSGYRYIHTSLGKTEFSPQEKIDLLIKRLDLIACISIHGNGLPGSVRLAHLHPNPELTQGIEELPPFYLDSDYPDTLEFITDLEKQIVQNTKRAEEFHSDNQAIVCALNNSSGYFEQDLEELNELCQTAGLIVKDTVVQFKDTPHVKYFLGKGKLEEIALDATLKEIDYLIFLQNLTPTQASAISQITDMKVLDRTQLILDIFAQRAQSHDGKLQVELAQLKYSLPRLREREQSLSRLVGGIGGRGPGETKLEIHRRRALDRIHKLERDIKNLSKKRESKRVLRKRKELPIVSIAGYTNAGKSTLLNTLTKAKALSEDKLFATLDPFSKRLRFPHDLEVILTDTVGFIRDLPPDLVQAFKATLEEIADADLLLHVVDISSPAFEQRIEIVDKLINELGYGEIPQLLVFNKSDLVDPTIVQNLARHYEACTISAIDRKSCRGLMEQIEARIWKKLKKDYRSFSLEGTT